MKMTPQQWIESRAAVAGMIACGVQGPGGKVKCQSADNACPESKMEQVLSLFDTIQTTLSTNAVVPLWSTWAFEQGYVRFAYRTDGWLLGMVVRPDSEACETLDHHTQEFLSLDKENG